MKSQKQLKIKKTMESQKEEDITKDIEDKEEEIKITKDSMEREDLKTRNQALNLSIKKLKRLKRMMMIHHLNQVTNNHKQDNSKESKSRS